MICLRRRPSRTSIAPLTRRHAAAFPSRRRGDGRGHRSQTARSPVGRWRSARRTRGVATSAAERRCSALRRPRLVTALASGVDAAEHGGTASRVATQDSCGGEGAARAGRRRCGRPATALAWRSAGAPDSGEGRISRASLHGGAAPRGAQARRRPEETSGAVCSGPTRLEAELGAAPVATLRIVADLVVRLVAEPLRDLPVLLCLAGELLLDHERLVSRLRARERPEREGGSEAELGIGAVASAPTAGARGGARVGGGGDQRRSRPALRGFVGRGRGSWSRPSHASPRGASRWGSGGGTTLTILAGRWVGDAAGAASRSAGGQVSTPWRWPPSPPPKCGPPEATQLNGCK
jgi:hypothetical protein